MCNLSTVLFFFNPMKLFSLLGSYAKENLIEFIKTREHEKDLLSWNIHPTASSLVNSLTRPPPTPPPPSLYISNSSLTNPKSNSWREREWKSPLSQPFF